MKSKRTQTPEQSQREHNKLPDKTNQYRTRRKSFISKAYENLTESLINRMYQAEGRILGFKDKLKEYVKATEKYE